jgi:glycosyltransferase involved in cell wall biosynthesis
MSVSSPPLVSIIIPTHNRTKYAIPTIRTLLAISDQIEIVVCDTTSEDYISREFIQELTTTKFKLAL